MWCLAWKPVHLQPTFKWRNWVSVSKCCDNGIPPDAQWVFHLFARLTTKAGFLWPGVEANYEAKDLRLVCRTYLGNWYPLKVPLHSNVTSDRAGKRITLVSLAPTHYPAQANAEWGNLTPKEITNCCVYSHLQLEIPMKWWSCFPEPFASLTGW